MSQKSSALAQIITKTDNRNLADPGAMAAPDPKGRVEKETGGGPSDERETEFANKGKPGGKPRDFN